MMHPMELTSVVSRDESDAELANWIHRDENRELFGFLLDDFIDNDIRSSTVRTQDEIASKLATTRQTLHKWRAGKETPTSSNLGTLFRELPDFRNELIRIKQLPDDNPAEIARLDRLWY